ncbi:MAG: DNA methyltransferase [Planctomycetes bacterium]|nr:DNA methyltransferase [Planctomycetota bacterium]
MIKYIGSKRVLVPAIVEVVGALPEVTTVVDFFSGTSRVGHALKREGYRVVANDFLSYAHVLATCYVQADRETVAAEAGALIDELNRLPGTPGYFTETFCERSRFFQPRNGARVDAIRDAIAAMDLAPDLEAVLLVSLMEAADRVDSTTGVQMAYLKSWAPRSFNDLQLRLPDVLPRPAGGSCEAHRLEARDAADALTGDLAYIDPPYNQHAYLGNYHIWETLVRWDRPEVYGIACKRIDCRTRKSDFNRRATAEDALRDFLAHVDCRYLVVSFSNEGFIERALMESVLAEHGAVRTLERDHKRYVGAQIGIHNPRGERVGKVSHLRNTEYLYVVERPSVRSTRSTRSATGASGTRVTTPEQPR